MPHSTETQNLRLRTALLLPSPSAADTIDFLPDALVLTDAAGVVSYVGPYATRPAGSEAADRADLLIPPLLDCHIHIPQNPIRGRFVEGVTGDEPEGPLLAGLARNVFPAEARCADPAYAEATVRRFLADTRATGTLGGVAYMTSSPAATRIALEILPPSWRVGLVLMDQLCPENLRIDIPTAAQAMTELAQDFGQRFIVTDRFAVACSTPLRKAGVEAAHRFNLDTQTHLSEQPGELATIRRLYPHAKDYTDVYDTDGLLTPPGHAILAHCIHLTPREWSRLAEVQARIAHCPISNTLLGSGTMPLDAVYAHDLNYAICTDVGASPTTSLLTEMTHFLKVHTSPHATPETALYRTTASPHPIARLQIGGLEVGKPFAAVEIAGRNVQPSSSATEVITTYLLGNPNDPIDTIARQVEGRVLRTWS